MNSWGRTAKNLEISSLLDSTIVEKFSFRGLGQIFNCFTHPAQGEYGYEQGKNQRLFLSKQLIARQELLNMLEGANLVTPKMIFQLPMYSGPSPTIHPFVCPYLPLSLYDLKRLSSSLLHTTDVF